MSAETQRLFDIVAAVAYLRTLGATTATKHFVRGLINTAQVPHLRIGKRFYLSREALDAWIEKQQRRRRP